MIVVQLVNIGKVYRHYSSEFKRIANWFGFHTKSVEETWVLRNISFTLEQGEAIALAGQNGAGKSSLLKIIAGTTAPSEGQVKICNSVSAILELGMGFNPDFTGRQNAYNTLSIMGFSNTEINNIMPEIEAFAEIGEYFDQPIRVYSSGMQVRVAFAVATAFRPEVLIVDEALSVGDSYFQHKSFARIKAFQEKGTALLLVSHDRSAIQALCNRVILLDAGRIIKDGEPEAVMDYYNAMIAKKENQRITQKQHKTGKTQTESGTKEAEILSSGLYSEDGKQTERVIVGQKLFLNVKAITRQALDALVLGYMIKDRLGQTVFGTNTWHTGQQITQLKANEIIDFSIEFVANIGVGNYSITLALTDSHTHLSKNYQWIDLALVFEVENTNQIEFVGNNWIPPHINVQRDTINAR